MFSLAFPPTAAQVSAMADSNIDDAANAPMINRQRMGLGHHHPALHQHSLDPEYGARQSMPYEPEFAFPTHSVNFFSWKSGNLNRFAHGDVLVEMASNGKHPIGALQEGDSFRITNLCIQRGIAEFRNSDGSLRFHSGGTGLKVIRPLHEEDIQQIGTIPGNTARWANAITRPGQKKILTYPGFIPWNTRP